MQNTHHLYCADSRHMEPVADNSVDLIVTSPPYPMIAMWDEQFASADPEIAAALQRADGPAAWEAMHRQLDRVWSECVRVVKPGGFICVNIGDATRTVDGVFRLYSNHSRIIAYLLSLGLVQLPVVLWRKQTNSPTKFMGSGMLPAGAYVTLEHEYVLIFRKGGRRKFLSDEARRLRRRSALWWEERNRWFSDVWDFKGSRQRHAGAPEPGSRQLFSGDIAGGAARERSGAFPFELAYRLIHMYSVQTDVVLDPFAGTGTTLAAAMAGGRSSIGIELEDSFVEFTRRRLLDAQAESNACSRDRLQQHQLFIEQYSSQKGAPKHYHEFYRFAVVTAQETDIRLPFIAEILPEKERIIVEHTWTME
jgi:modification methylase